MRGRNDETRGGVYVKRGRNDEVKEMRMGKMTEQNQVGEKL